MATTELEDDFNRSNEELSASSDWIETGYGTATDGDLDIVSSKCSVTARGTGGDPNSQRVVGLHQTALSSIDCYTQFSIRHDTLSFHSGLLARSDADCDNCYYSIFRKGNNDIHIYRVISGAATQFASISLSNQTNDDVMRMEIETTDSDTVTIRCYQNGDLAGTITDTNASRIINLRQCGMAAHNDGDIFNDFEAGILANAAKGSLSTIL